MNLNLTFLPSVAKCLELLILYITMYNCEEDKYKDEASLLLSLSLSLLNSNQ